MPEVIRLAVVGVASLIVLHVIDVGVLLSNYSYIVAKIINAMRDTVPTLTEGQLYDVAKWVTVAGIGYHLISVALYSWLVFPLRAGKQFARVTLTIVLILNFVGSLYTFSSLPLLALKVFIVIGWLLQIALILLLWVPEKSEEYFSK